MALDILVVEDSPTQALRLKLLLENAGFAVTLAEGGGEAIRKATQRPPAAVVLDVNLPDIDGFHVCRTLKQYHVTSGIPVIMLTIEDRAHETLIGLSAGADAYLPKDGFAGNNLLEALEDLGLLDPRK